jgi:hypothetical protein
LGFNFSSSSVKVISAYQDGISRLFSSSMLCHDIFRLLKSNIVHVCVDFLCLDFGVQMVREIPRSMSPLTSAVGVDSI